MGFGFTFFTPRYHFKWPGWFREKYDEEVEIGTTLSPKRECKGFWLGEHYMDEFAEDLRRAIPWDEFECRYKGKILNNFVIYFVGECYGIQCVHITRDRIWTTWPGYWEEDGGVRQKHSDSCEPDCQWSGCSNDPFKPESTPKPEPPPIQTGSHAEKQMLVQAARIIEELVGEFDLAQCELTDNAMGLVDRVKLIYGGES